jgi:hypothetical protein
VLLEDTLKLVLCLVTHLGIVNPSVARSSPLYSAAAASEKKKKKKKKIGRPGHVLRSAIFRHSARLSRRSGRRNIDELILAP